MASTEGSSTLLAGYLINSSSLVSCGFLTPHPTDLLLLFKIGSINNDKIKKEVNDLIPESIKAYRIPALSRPEGSVHALGMVFLGSTQSSHKNQWEFTLVFSE